MRKVTLSLALAMVPAIAMGQQATSTVQASASTSATVQTPRSQTTASGNAQASSTATSSTDVPPSYAAENRAKLEGTFSVAREKNLPQQPIRDRIAEGRARGASEAQVVIAAQHTELRLETAQRAVIRAGRPQPSQGEVASADQAMVRGASDAQVQTVVQHTPSDRSIVVALDALTRLEAQGMTADHAVAQITASQNANASDQSIGQLQTATSAQVAGAIGALGAGTSTSGSVTGAASTAGATAAGASAGVTGTVGAVIKKPPF